MAGMAFACGTVVALDLASTDDLKNSEANKSNMRKSGCGSAPQMSSKPQSSDSGARKAAAPLFGKQSSKDILADASGSSAKSPYAAARPQPASAARGGSQCELLFSL
jgi:hypothetical protein